MEFISLFILFAGYIIGLGAVTVIDIHGFLGKTSSYWTEATTRTHKVTKPLIWIGIILVIIGGIIFYALHGVNGNTITHIIIVFILILNGLFLSFRVSPYLLEQEKRGEERKLLPKRLQTEITISFIVSFIGWWLSFGIFVYMLGSRLS